MTAEPPLQVESREELVYLLGEACEIEHGLMCEYLYAQFSLKRTADEGLTPEQLARVQAWEATLIDVIKQEMLHLALATNILTAVGAAPHFERPNLPILSRWYPPEVQIALLPFGEQALRHFMYLERPEGMTLADAEGFAALPDIPPLASLDRPVVAVPEQWQTVGHLYRGIEAGLARLCDRYGEEAVFIGPPAAQAITATFEWKELTAVTDLAVSEPGDRADRGAGRGRAGRLGQVALRQVRGHPRGLPRDAGRRPGLRPGAAGRARLRPAATRRGVGNPDRGSAHGPGGRPLQRPVRGDTAGPEPVLRSPRRDARRTRDAGPDGETPDELGDAQALPGSHHPADRPLAPRPHRRPDPRDRPARDYFVLPHREPAWKIINERLDVLTETCAALAQEPGLAALSELAGDLRAMAGDIRTHLDERAAASGQRLAKTARTAATLHPRLPQSRRKHELPHTTGYRYFGHSEKQEAAKPVGGDA